MSQQRRKWIPTTDSLRPMLFPRIKWRVAKVRDIWTPQHRLFQSNIGNYIFKSRD